MSGRARSFAMVGLEALLLAAGVFLGMMGDQWRDDRRASVLVEESLRRFESEVSANQARVEAAVQYHDTLGIIMEAWLSAPDVRPDGFAGLNEVRFERSAWDLALATESLGGIERWLPF